MALNRPLLAITGGALVVILSGLGALAHLTLRTTDLAERLVREANALERATYPRPAHVSSPSPGTFGQAVGPLMDDVLRALDTRPALVGAVARECEHVSIGNVEPHSTRADCLGVLERERALMNRVLAATHAASGGLPTGLGIPSDPAHPHENKGLEALLHVVRLAALETRLQLLAGKTEAAVDTCVDALALGREMTLGAGTKGRMKASHAYQLLYPPCAAALGAAPAARKRLAAAQLVTLREGMPRLSQSLREDAVAAQLPLYAHLFFDDEERAALAPLSARIVAAGPRGFWVLERHEDPWLRLEWRRAVRMFDTLLAVADLPAERRRRFLDAATRRPTDFWSNLPGRRSPTWDNHLAQVFQECADIVERQLSQLEALITLAGQGAP